MTKHGWGRRTVSFLLLVLLPACYSYVPLESGGPNVGQDVQIHVAEGSSQAGLARDDGTITGMVLRSWADSITVSRKRAGSSHTGVGSDVLRDTVTLSRAEISEIDGSRLDAGRTAVLVALGAGVIAGAVVLVANANPNNSTGGGGPGTGRMSRGGGLGFKIPIHIP